MESETIEAAVSDALATWGVQFKALYQGRRAEQRCNGKWGYDAWSVAFYREGKDVLTTAYNMGVAYDGKAPEAGEVLSCLLNEGEADSQSFDDWCAEFGFDNDSIKDLNTYLKCCASGRALRNFFRGEELKTLTELVKEY